MKHTSTEEVTTGGTAPKGKKDKFKEENKTKIKVKKKIHTIG